MIQQMQSKAIQYLENLLFGTEPQKIQELLSVVRAGGRANQDQIDTLLALLTSGKNYQEESGMWAFSTLGQGRKEIIDIIRSEEVQNVVRLALTSDSEEKYLPALAVLWTCSWSSKKYLKVVVPSMERIAFFLDSDKFGTKIAHFAMCTVQGWVVKRKPATLFALKDHLVPILSKNPRFQEVVHNLLDQGDAPAEDWGDSDDDEEEEEPTEKTRSTRKAQNQPKTSPVQGAAGPSVKKSLATSVVAKRATPSDKGQDDPDACQTVEKVFDGEVDKEETKTCFEQANHGGRPVDAKASIRHGLPIGGSFGDDDRATSPSDACEAAPAKKLRMSSSFSIPDNLLKEEVRKLMWQNMHIFNGKIVLDVGCGTGILSMFAAKAGAAHVYGIDTTGAVEEAKEVAKNSIFADKVTFIQGKMEEIDLPIKKVDVIISEWMGYCLFYESMIDQVIYARDKYLTPGGLMFPDQATLYVCAIEDWQYKDDKISKWKNVYGFDASTPLVRVVNQNQVVTNSCLLQKIDLHTCTVADIPFESPFELQINRDDHIQALVTFFEIKFTKCNINSEFSTAPKSPYTHWKQTVFYLQDCITGKKGEKLVGVYRMSLNLLNNRAIDFEIDVDFRGEVSTISEKNKYQIP